MIKRIIAVVLILCLGCCVFAACGKVLTTDEVYQVVLDDLGVAKENAGSPHIHEGTFNGVQCYNVYVTVEGVQYQYVVSLAGTILSKGTGSHSH